MHINEMLNKKTYIGDIEPNPKEFGIWIKNDGSHMIYDYTNREWICNCSGSSKVLYYKVAAGADLGADLELLLQSIANLKIYDTSENKIEYLPIGLAMTDGGNGIYNVAPNFSFVTDEYCFAFLPMDVSVVIEGGSDIHVIAHTLEDIWVELGQEMPSGITRITEEEYWDDMPPELLIIDISGESAFDDYFINWEIPADQYIKIMNGEPFKLLDEDAISPFTTATYNPDYVLDDILNYNEDEIYFEFDDSYGGSSCWTGGRLPDGRCFIGYVVA